MFNKKEKFVVLAIIQLISIPSQFVQTNAQRHLNVQESYESAVWFKTSYAMGPGWAIQPWVIN